VRVGPRRTVGRGRDRGSSIACAHGCAGTTRHRETMATFVLIHGAGDVGWYWHLVEAELRARGHDVVAPDLPCEDGSAGLPEYADAVVEAIGERIDLVVVAQSLGAFTAPLVCERVGVDLLVLVAPMIPLRGRRPPTTGRTRGTRRSRASPTTTRSRFSTRTFRPSSRRRRCGEGAGSPRLGCTSRRRSRPGPTSPRASSSVETIACSRPPSSVAWPTSASASPRTRSMAGTPRR
jgi:pimeloyl-ACP methyl ester carboxylesterase